MVFYNLAPGRIKYRLSVPIPNYTTFSYMSVNFSMYFKTADEYLVFFLNKVFFLAHLFISTMSELMWWYFRTEHFEIRKKLLIAGFVLEYIFPFCFCIECPVMIWNGMIICITVQPQISRLGFDGCCSELMSFSFSWASLNACLGRQPDEYEIGSIFSKLLLCVFLLLKPILSCCFS